MFLSLGEQYNPDHQFTVEELLGYDLMAHADTINSIYACAVAEYQIEQNLHKLQKTWTEKEFTLAKHLPDSLYRRG